MLIISAFRDLLNEDEKSLLGAGLELALRLVSSSSGSTPVHPTDVLSMN